MKIKFIEKDTGREIGPYERDLYIDVYGDVMEVRDSFSGVDLSWPANVIYEIVNEEVD